MSRTAQGKGIGFRDWKSMTVAEERQGSDSEDGGRERARRGFSGLTSLVWRLGMASVFQQRKLSLTAGVYETRCALLGSSLLMNVYQTMLSKGSRLRS
jgi:hypothetical protein